MCLIFVYILCFLLSDSNVGVQKVRTIIIDVDRCDIVNNNKKKDFSSIIFHRGVAVSRFHNGKLQFGFPILFLNFVDSLKNSNT